MGTYSDDEMIPLLGWLLAWLLQVAQDSLNNIKYKTFSKLFTSCVRYVLSLLCSFFNVCNISLANQVYM